MNPRIFIHSVTLRGGSADEVITYTFAPGVNVVVGSVGTGKTSLLQGIKWNLGGNAVRSSAVRTAVQSSALDVTLNGRRFLITRYADRNDVEVLDQATGELVAHARAAGQRVGAPVSMSDFLLDQLGIPRITVPRARSRARREQTSVSFWDVLDYLYVSQSRMDSSIVNHNDRVLDAKRKATFELLYGLLDEDVAALERAAGEIKSQVLETKNVVRGIRAFLEGGDTPAESALRLEQERLSVQVAEATHRVTAIRVAARSETPDSEGIRARVLEQEALVGGLRQRVRAAAVEVARYDALVAQLEVDLDRLDRGEVAVQVLAPFEFTTCPRCGQRLKRITSDEHCLLCLQPEPPAPDAGVFAAERDRLEAQLAETLSLRAASEQAKVDAAVGLEKAEARLRELHAELDSHVEGFVSRQFDEIEEATRTLAAATARQQSVATLIGLHDRYRVQSEVVPRLEQAFKSTNLELAAARTRLEAAREKIGRLSELFDELLKEFKYPWYPPGGAWIDRETYLPVVGPDSGHDHQIWPHFRAL